MGRNTLKNDIYLWLMDLVYGGGSAIESDVYQIAKEFLRRMDLEDGL